MPESALSYGILRFDVGVTAFYMKRNTPPENTYPGRMLFIVPFLPGTFHARKSYYGL